MPRIVGCSGSRARARKASTYLSSIISRIVSIGISSIFWTSCEVRKPSKKWRNGTRLSSVDAWATIAMSCASCTELEQSIAKPVWRHAITSPWSPKMQRPWHARERAETWNTVGVSSPAILYMFGIISRRPCEAVNVVVSEPVVSEPCTAPAAPPSDSISTIEGIEPQMFVFACAASSSHVSAIGEEGVIG